ncbi:MAG: ABC transporter ATP-binding protein [bacterium]
MNSANEVRSPDCPMPLLEVDAVGKVFVVNNTRSTVLEDISFCCLEGELICILGPSGCGKTTLMRLIAGFDSPSRGAIRMGGEPLSGPGPDRCVIFQEDALFPWLTVWENVAFGIRRNRKDGRALRSEVNHFLSLVGLENFGNYLPREISLGMKQRVALARVLIMKPRILLMDEPFASLDVQTRQEMHKLLLKIWQELSQSIIFVTHDVEESIILADSILLFEKDPGRIKGHVKVELPRPRDSESQEFLKLKKSLRQSIMSC